MTVVIEKGMDTGSELRSVGWVAVASEGKKRLRIISHSSYLDFFRFSRMSEQRPGQVPGDVVIRLKVRDHPVFKRKGREARRPSFSL